jgi:drug/metabolite transporter (DMT)-like permease
MRLIRKDKEGKHPTYMSWPMNHYKIMGIWTASGIPAWILLYYSLDVLPVGLAETIQNFTPFMTVVIGYYTLRETMKTLEIVNMMISFLGVMLIVMFSTNYTNQQTHSGQ